MPTGGALPLLFAPVKGVLHGGEARRGRENAGGRHLF